VRWPFETLVAVVVVASRRLWRGVRVGKEVVRR
jgi:hypothetical protein